MEKAGVREGSDIRNRVNLNIDKIQERFESVFEGKQTTVKGFVAKPKVVENE